MKMNLKNLVLALLTVVSVLALGGCGTSTTNTTTVAAGGNDIAPVTNEDSVLGDWIVSKIYCNDELMNINSLETLTISFKDNGTFTVKDGATSYSGVYTQTGVNISCEADGLVATMTISDKGSTLTAEENTMGFTAKTVYARGSVK